MLPASFDSGGQAIPWETFEPTAGNGAAIILVYGSDGMAQPWDEMIRGHAKALAAEGFLAIIPDYFVKGAGVAHGNSAKVFGEILTKHDEWGIAVEDAAKAAGKLPGVKSQRIGFLGYSLGGFLCLRARRYARALVAYFAPHKFPTFGVSAVLSGLGPSAKSPLIVQIHHGGADSLVPYDLHALPIEAEIKAEGATVALIKYDKAGHGFIGSDSANRKALADATKATIEFFKTNL